MKEKLGLYDSGIGGISVLIGMIKEWKGGEYIYCGDNKNAPYGSRSEEELLRLAEENVRRLTESGATRIVLACNTLSVTVLETLRAVSPVPVHGFFRPILGRAERCFPRRIRPPHWRRKACRPRSILCPDWREK